MKEEFKRNWRLGDLIKRLSECQRQGQLHGYFLVLLGHVQREK